METIDVTGLPKDRIEYIKNMIALWKKQDNGAENAIPPVPDIPKRKVDPSEFAVTDSKLKAPYSRDLAYED